MFAALMPYQAQILPAAYAQDKAGGSVAGFLPDPALAVLPCAIQQDADPDDEPGGQGRRRSKVRATLFFAVDPGVRENDQVRVAVAGRTRKFSVVGPAFDRSGQAGGLLAAGTLWQLAVAEFR